MLVDRYDARLLLDSVAQLGLKRKGALGLSAEEAEEELIFDEVHVHIFIYMFIYTYLFCIYTFMYIYLSIYIYIYIYR